MSSIDMVFWRREDHVESIIGTFKRGCVDTWLYILRLEPAHGLVPCKGATIHLAVWPDDRMNGGGRTPATTLTTGCAPYVHVVGSGLGRR